MGDWRSGSAVRLHRKGHLFESGIPYQNIVGWVSGLNQWIANPSYVNKAYPGFESRSDCQKKYGEVAERSKASVLKTEEPLRVPRVRIPVSLPKTLRLSLQRLLSEQVKQSVGELYSTFTRSLFTVKCGYSSVGRASAFQAECRRFEPDCPLQKTKWSCSSIGRASACHAEGSGIETHQDRHI